MDRDGQKRRPHVTLEEAMRLNGVEDWALSPLDQDFLIRLTEAMLEDHGREWMLRHRGLLRAQLEIALKF